MDHRRRDVSPEVNRYIEWMAATFEIEHGVDVRGNADAMMRLAEIARIAHAQRGRQQLHVDSLAGGMSLTATLGAEQLDAIFDGTTPAPDVEPSRLRRREERDEGRGWNMQIVAVVIISGLVFSTLIAAVVIHWVNEQHEERNEKHELKHETH
jgi:hypothetical protein